MTNRRSFLSTLSAGGVWFARPDWLNTANGTIRVVATPTVFFAHPDGSRNLVRFEVSGIDAPAGRLRVFDRSRRLLGTAGLLRTGDSLYGELWMLLEDTVRAVSELEAPGVRGPFRTTHRLVPGRRWTIHLMTVADPDSLAATLSQLRPIHRAVQTSLFRNSSVTVNPFRAASFSRQEHVPFIRMAERALSVEREYAIPVGTAAYVPPDEYLPGTGALALAGAGVRILVIEQETANPFQWWEVPGGVRVLVVAVPPGSTPTALGFGLNQADMTGSVEDWLASTALRFSPDEDSGTAVVLNSSADETLPATLAAVSSWNSRFAYPQVVVADYRTLMDGLIADTTTTSVVPPTSVNTPRAPTGQELVTIRETRALLSSQRTRDLGVVLGQVIGTGHAELETVAAYIATSVPGTMVFNPSPYQHSDLVCMSDGSERLATNVPGLGYAFFPDNNAAGDSSAWEPSASTFTLVGEQLRVTVERATGAISSLMQRSDGKEWVRSGSAGLNTLDNARLLDVAAERLDGAATRLVVSRWAPTVGTFASTITVYDELPWVSLCNETEQVADEQVSYHFHLAVPEPHVSWEVPAGFEASTAPVPMLEHLRWIRLADSDATWMVRGFDAPLAAVAANGTLTSIAPRGVSRYRLAPLPRFSSEDMPWVFGWNSESMTIARTEPNGLGLLPRYGSILEFDQVGVTVLGMRKATDGYGAIVYLQETLGVARTVSVGPGILRFHSAEKVDFLERYLEQIPIAADGAIRLVLPAYSVVAVRLSGMGLTNAS